MEKEPKKMLEKHRQLIHSDMCKVVSHVQRDDGSWILNTVMTEDCDVPFKYKRKKRYKSIQGQRVNLTYYPATENVAGIEFEIMTVVRIKVS